MNLRELHNQLTEMLRDGYGDCEVVVGNNRGGVPVEVVEVRGAVYMPMRIKMDSEYVYRGASGRTECITRVIRLARRQL